nr:unnamed protein product [Spirometra erinaceieuropaei]
MTTATWDWPNGASEEQQTSVKHDSMLSIHAARCCCKRRYANNRWKTNGFRLSIVQLGLRKPGCGHGYRFLQLQACFVHNIMTTATWDWPNGASEEQQTSVKHDSMLSIHAARCCCKRRSPVTALTSSTAAATTTTAVVVGTNAINGVATPTFSTTSSVHGADFAVTNSTTNVPLSAGLGAVQTIDATTTASPTAATFGHPDTPNATQSATAKVVVRNGTPTTTSTTTTAATRMVDIEAGGDSSDCRGVHASVSDAVPCPLTDSVSALKCTDCLAVAVVAETLNPIDTTAGTLVDAGPFPTTFSSTVYSSRGVEGVESIAFINPSLLITRPVDNVYLVSTIILITLPTAAAVEDVDATATATSDDDADAALIAATTPIHFASLACR